MSEETSLLNSGIRTNSSLQANASSSTVAVDIPDTTEASKNYGAADTTRTAIEPCPQSIYNGIRDMLLSSFSFAIMHLTMKLLIKDGYPVSQALAFRSVSTVLVCTLYARIYNIEGGGLGPIKDRFWLNFRGVVGSFATITFYISMTHLDLGDSVAMTFIAPVLMPILACLWLRETYTFLDSAATFFAMAGVIFISKPAILFGSDGSGEASSALGISFALVSAITGAIGNISIRKVSSKAHSIHVVNYMMLWTIPTCAVMIGANWSSMDFNFTPKAILFFSIVAGCSFFGQFLMSRSLLTTPTRYVTPIIFTQVIFAYINQFVFWHIQPTSSSTFGVILVAFSLFLLHFKI